MLYYDFVCPLQLLLLKSIIISNINADYNVPRKAGGKGMYTIAPGLQSIGNRMGNSRSIGTKRASDSSTSPIVPPNMNARVTNTSYANGRTMDDKPRGAYHSLQKELNILAKSYVNGSTQVSLENERDRYL